MNRLTYALFAGIILLGIVLRLYRFDNPIADWHSWRQVDTSSVSRNFVNNGFDVLHPTFHDLSNVPSGKDNPNGYRFVEFPIYNLFQAGFYSLFGIFSLEEWGRIVTIVSSVLSITFIFLLLKKYTDSTAALSAAFLYAILPYNIYYGRVVLPDPTTSMTILGSIFFFDLWINNGKKIATIKSIVYFIFALIFTASALLLKPFALFFMLPMVAIAYNAFGLNMFKKGQLYIFAALSLAPLMGWRLWMTQFPEGIPASDWLLNGGNIRFKPSFFNWIFANRIGGLILGFWGAVFLVVGLVINSNSEKIYGFLKGQMLIFWAFLISSLAYLIVVARGNVQHDYYQILIIPTIVIFGGLGMKFFINPPKD
jgi:4-amino-4-deoxy-L-arabinose transferase-like glycosyltransferase